MPTLTSADAGKLVSVNDAGDGFSLAEAQKGMDPLIGSYEDITPAQVKDAISAGRSCFVEIPSLGTIGSWTTAMGKVYGSGIQIGIDGTSFGGFGISEDNSGNWEFGLLTGELLPNTASLAWGYLFYDGEGTWSTRQGVVHIAAKELFDGAMPRWDGISWEAVPGLPVPTAADAGKTIRVNAEGNEYELVGSDDSGSGINYKIGHGLKIVNGDTLQVDTADAAQQDNTLPITSAAVYQITGNIDALLQQI